MKAKVSKQPVTTAVQESLDVFARESFRKESYFSDIAVGIISGLGAEGYIAALTYAAKLD